MSQTECRKCHGTGEFLNGTCWDCGGSGTHKPIRYETTPADESSHPALRAERELKEEPFVPPNPELVERELMLMKEIIGSFEENSQQVNPIRQYDCQHVFERGQYGNMCFTCGMFEAQFHDSLTVG